MPGETMWSQKKLVSSNFPQAKYLRLTTISKTACVRLMANLAKIERSLIRGSKGREFFILTISRSSDTSRPVTSHLWCVVNSSGVLVSMAGLEIFNRRSRSSDWKN